MKKGKHCTFIAVIIMAIFAMTGCEQPDDPGSVPGNQTPAANDFTFDNMAQTEGSVTAVTIRPQPGKSSGARTVYYEGISPTSYTKSTTVPQTVGSYAVTFNVAAAAGWNAANGLSAGTLTIKRPNQTPAADDYTFGNMAQTAGSVTAVTIWPKDSASPGAVNNILYDGTPIVPQTLGSYAVTFDVVVVAGWNAASGLSAGTLEVNNKETPVVTWPTGMTATYGQKLLHIWFNSNSDDPPGYFSWTAQGDSVGDAGEQSHNMTFYPSDTAKYNPVTGDVIVTVNKADPPVIWPTGLMADYGQTLSQIPLDSYTNNPPGMFSWTTPSDSVGNAGTPYPSHGMTFTPDDTANYNTVTGYAIVRVSKIAPAVTWPTGLTAAYGQTLSQIPLDSYANDPPGEFRWQTPTQTVGNLGTQSRAMTFIPTDTTNYNNRNSMVTITISKANPAVTWPGYLNANYGQKLSDISLDSSTNYNNNNANNQKGTFRWTTPSASVGDIGSRPFSMTFTPTETAYYNTVTQDVSVTVSPAPPTWPVIRGVVYGQRLSDIPLDEYTNGGTGAFSWKTPADYVGYVGMRTHRMIFTTTSPNYRDAERDVDFRVMLDVKMEYVSSGSFQMGKELGTAVIGDVTPVSTVRLNNGFYMGKYEVTQKQYYAVMQSLPPLLTSANYGMGDDYPVHFTSWYDAVEYCNRLSIAEGLTPVYRINNSTNPDDWEHLSNSIMNAVTCNWSANGYRLPTEAQWEYAAKGGNTGEAFTYAGSDDGNAVAWYTYNVNPGPPGRTGSQPVGTRDPNGLGLYDMSGNVGEWCWDWYMPYTSENKTDPTGGTSGATGTERVIRGGDWIAIAIRSINREHDAPSIRSRLHGFRLVRPL